MNLLPLYSNSEDVFALIDLANIASDIIAKCRQRDTGTTLGGNDLVGQRAAFLVLVAYVWQ